MQEPEETTTEPGLPGSPPDTAAAFQTNYEALVRYACKFVDQPTAEDIVQDVFIQSHNRLPLNARGYLFSCVHNKCQDHLRRKTVHRKYVSEVLFTQQELDYYHPETGQKSLLENGGEVWQAIDSLPPRCREIVKMRYEQGMKTSEISDAMGISSRTVETQLYKAIKQLRGLLRKMNSILSALF